ncbi:hypothetical protein [Streptomyces sp. NPDC047014]|uniref:hypothetical protein n=1 Tax=Streptomyces sp. NPDC047014 TaxID=3155736 RepID=UPI0033FA48AD
MRTTIRGVVLAAGTLLALSGLVTTAAAEPLAPCTPASQPTARGVCLPVSSLAGLGMLFSKSRDCASNEFCVFPPLPRSAATPVLRND